MEMMEFMLFLAAMAVFGVVLAVDRIRDEPKDEIREIAEGVRRAFEGISLWPDLGGMCGRAAFQFFQEAERRGLQGVRLVEGRGHGFCKLADGRIVDVTATQFAGMKAAPSDGYAAVVIEELPEDPPSWHRELRSWGSVQEFLAFEGTFFGARHHNHKDRKEVARELNIRPPALAAMDMEAR